MRSMCCCLVLTGMAAMPGCGVDSALESAADLAQYEALLSRINGGRVNGGRVNGGRVNGTDLSATLSLNGSELVFLDASGALVASGTALVGAAIPSDLNTGEVVDLTIQSVTYDATAGVYLYGVTVPSAKNGKPEPLCGESKQQPILALALAGRYDNDTGASIPDSNYFTFACVDAAIGKCAYWGYHPAKSRSECLGSECKAQSLAPWHQACIHMVRADYCGDGTPHTRDGTIINIWDNLGIEQPDPSAWEMEAEWMADGARCIRHTRWEKADKRSALSDLQYVKNNCPNRLAVNQPAACGAETSDFHSAYGFYLAPVSRHLLRNQSEGNLKNSGDAKQ
jgi:hypothetical protein